MDNKEWEIIDKQKVVDTYIRPGLVTDGATYYKYEYIIQNKKTGELRRV